MDPLAQLNDIIELEQVSAWPLAWGWWLVIFLLVSLLVASLLYVHHKRQHSALLRLKRKHLEQCATIADISSQLKIVALHYYGSAKVQQLTGLKWLVFLNHQLPSKHQRPLDALKEIAAYMYQKQSQQAFAEYYSFAQVWLAHAAITKGQAIHGKEQVNV